ncbi:MAG: hypothetical protein P8N90_10855 [Glaciecola sp.]|nr:hypothetical protein [Glaciecola sp.]
MSMRHWAKLAPVIWFCCTLIIGTHVHAREYEPIKGGALELGGFDLYANERHRFEISSAYELGHVARGTVFSIGSGNQLATPDDFTQDITNPLDSRANSALIGVRWNSTRNTTGFAKIGMQQKNFDSSLRPDFSGAD